MGYRRGSRLYFHIFCKPTEAEMKKFKALIDTTTPKSFRRGQIESVWWEPGKWKIIFKLPPFLGLTRVFAKRVS